MNKCSYKSHLYMPYSILVLLIKFMLLLLHCTLINMFSGFSLHAMVILLFLFDVHYFPKIHSQFSVRTHIIYYYHMAKLCVW